MGMNHSGSVMSIMGGLKGAVGFERWLLLSYRIRIPFKSIYMVVANTAICYFKNVNRGLHNPLGHIFYQRHFIAACGANSVAVHGAEMLPKLRF